MARLSHLEERMEQEVYQVPSDRQIVQDDIKQHVKCDSVKEMKEYCVRALQELRGIVEKRCARDEKKHREAFNKSNPLQGGSSGRSRGCRGNR
ncbi:hypothetical protein E2C01_046403 [Portunus trituberculatus]|uniref:Uncharacterized protein n=1 Tax=Portunus trituberculatus TaxID=210409 RepID=A0A5B7G0V7_PORTR|nr:hypothetical protein [Portunus trituberculatus]